MLKSYKMDGNGMEISERTCSVILPRFVRATCFTLLPAMLILSSSATAAAAAAQAGDLSQKHVRYSSNWNSLLWRISHHGIVTMFSWLVFTFTAIVISGERF